MKTRRPNRVARLLGGPIRLLAAVLAAGSPLASQAEGLAGEPATRDAEEDVVPIGPRELLRGAFDNRYQLDARATVEVVVTSRGGATDRRHVQVASKWIDGRLHSMGRFTFPDELRDTTLLAIENDDRDDDHFVYLPELRRVRRVSSAQRSDLFVGTDLTFEDLERREDVEFEVELLRSAEIDGERVAVVRATPNYDSGYSRVEYFIAPSDKVIVQTRYYKDGAETPFKLMKSPRSQTQTLGGHVLPKWLVVEDLEHGTRTEVTIEKLAVNPKLSRKLFTLQALSIQKRMPAIPD